MEHEVDLNLISKEELSEYKIFQTKTTVSSTLVVNGAELIDKIDIDLLKDLPNLLNNIEHLADEYGIKQDDKLLFICEGGKSTRVLAILFDNAGYDASFARLKRLSSTSANLFSTPIERISDEMTSLIVVPYDWRDSNKKDIYYTFDLIKPKKFLSSGQAEALEVVSYDEFEFGDMENKNVVCSFNLHCVLTKYLLDSQGIGSLDIYKLPVDEELYYDGNLYDLPKSVRDSYDNYDELISDLEYE